MENEAMYAVLLFILMSFIVSIAFKDEIHKTKKKHILAGMFMFFAAIIYTIIIILTL